MPARVTVIIVNYNAGARLSRALACLDAQTVADFDVIVFDNASRDNSLDGVEESPRRRIVRHGANIGFAAANNRAGAMTEAEWLAFLNPDAYPEPGWLAALLDGAARHPGADAFGSTQIDAADPERLDGAGDAFHAFGLPYRGHFGWPAAKIPPEGETFAACAAAALYRRSAFTDLGGFDESFFCYGEDVDLGFRLRLAGGRTVQIAAARVLHEGSGVTGRHSDFSIYYGHRNRVWTYFKNMPAWLLWPTAPFHAAVNAALFLRYAATGKAGAYGRAMRDAVRQRARIFDERRVIQRARRASLPDIAKALTWSPLKAVRREAAIRPAGAAADDSERTP